MEIPTLYQYDNTAGAFDNPTTVTTNTGMRAYFEKYLFEKFLSVYEWDLPKEWAKNYFLYCLYIFGKVAVFRTDRYGIICQGCGLRGWDIYYQPTHAVITNPLLEGIRDLRIGEGCEIIKMNPNFSGMYDIIQHYADMMAITTEAVDTNIFNSKIAYVFACMDDKQAISFRTMYEKISAGTPAVFVDKHLYEDDGTERWKLFGQNISNQYIADKLLVNLKQIEAMFDAEIGINNANTEKKERLIVDEVNANNEATSAKAALWLETMQECCEKVNALYNIGLSVKRRETAENGITGGENDEQDN